MKGLWLLETLTCSCREDGLSCRHGVKPPLTPSSLMSIGPITVVLYNHFLVWWGVLIKETLFPFQSSADNVRTGYRKPVALNSSRTIAIPVTTNFSAAPPVRPSAGSNRTVGHISLSVRVPIVCQPCPPCLKGRPYTLNYKLKT